MSLIGCSGVALLRLHSTSIGSLLARLCAAFGLGIPQSMILCQRLTLEGLGCARWVDGWVGLEELAGDGGEVRDPGSGGWRSSLNIKIIQVRMVVAPP